MTRARCLSGGCTGTRAEPHTPVVHSTALERLAWCEHCWGETRRATVEALTMGQRDEEYVARETERELLDGAWRAREAVERLHRIAARRARRRAA